MIKIAQKKLVYFSILILILLLGEFVQINSSNSTNYTITNNSFNQSPLVSNYNNMYQGVMSSGNLTIKAFGLNNGLKWDAIIDGQNYSSCSDILNVSLHSGNYTIDFYSAYSWGAPQNVSITSGSKTIEEHFYRLENLSSETGQINQIISASNLNNYTALLWPSGIQIINRTTGNFEGSFRCYFNSNPASAFLGVTGSNYVFGGGIGNFHIYSYNPKSKRQKLIMDPSSLSSIGPYCCQDWQFSLSSMAVWHNEAFLSFKNIQTQDNSIFGIVYLNNSTFINLTESFPTSLSGKISSYAGNGEFLIGINDSWFLLNGSTSKVTYEESLGNSISPLTSAGNIEEKDNYISFNGTSFIIGNQTKIIALNPMSGKVSDLFSTNKGTNISAIYGNSSTIIVGLNYRGNLSLDVLQGNNNSESFITKTNATKSVQGCITTIDPSGNIMLLAGANNGNRLYLFTDTNYTGLTFIECGLEPGLMWTVTLNGNMNNLAGQSLNFGNLSSGCYCYAVYSSSEFNSTYLQGHVFYERGQSIVIVTQFTVRYIFCATNYAYYPLYGNMVVRLTNQLNQRMNNCFRINPTEVCFQLPYGNYSYCALMTQSFTRSVSGYITPENGSNIERITFVKASFTTTFNVTNENTQYSQWNIVLCSQCKVTQTYGISSNGYNTTSASGSGSMQKVFKLQNNNYRYTLTLQYHGSYTNHQKTGSICVNGTSTTINITFVNYYPVCISESGIPEYSSIGHFLEHGWGFVIYNNQTNAQVAGCPYPFYNTPIARICLPDGNYKLNALTSIYKPQENITYFKVNGKPVDIAISYSPIYYTVLLNEIGISSEYKWYANSSNGNYSAYGGSSIKLNATEGFNCFTLTTNDKFYAPKEYYHYFIQSMLNKSLTVGFSKAYRVKINEFGLPSNTIWYFNISGQKSENSTNKSLTAIYPEGNFTFCSTSKEALYSTDDMSSHHLSVTGNETINLSFVEYTQKITFYFYTSDYPSMHFHITLCGGLMDSTYYGNSSNNGRCTIATFNVPNGTYNYVAKANNSNYSSISGVIEVANYYPTNNYLEFLPYEFYVTFRELGLQQTSNWGINLTRDGQNEKYYSLGFSTLEIKMSNGTYDLTAFAGVGGYGSSMTNYTTVINSTITEMNVTFYSLYNPDISQSNIFFAGLTSQFFDGLFMIAGISALTSMMVLVRRRLGKVR